MKTKTIILLILIILCLIIILQNSQAVYLHLLFWKIGMSQIILTLTTLLIGFIVGFVVAKLTGKKPGKAFTEASPSESARS